jgi:uncharacterized protein
VIIDADSHVCEPPDAWTSRMASKWGDMIPHVRRIEAVALGDDAAVAASRTGGGGEDSALDQWFIGDAAVGMGPAITVMYKGEDGSVTRRDTLPAFPKTYDEIHPSSWDPNERVKVMDRFGIASAALYPNLGLTSPDFYKNVPNATLEFQVAVLQAYNDFVLSWEQQQPGRFLPLAVIPYWDIDECVKEVERCAALGHKGFVMTGTPELHDSPILADRHWDPLWSAAQAAGRPIAFHAATSGDSTRAEQHMSEGHRSLMVKMICTMLLDNAIATTDLLMSGVLPRFPDLHFAIVETGSGWIPFVLETLDVHYPRYKPWLERPEFNETELPSFYFERQVFVNNWYEKMRKDDLDLIPIGNVMFETDYPHPTSLIGDEITHAIDVNLQALSDTDRDKVLYENAMRCFNLTPDDIAAPNPTNPIPA